VPAKQLAHAEAPVVTENMPTAQLEHEDEAAAAYKPVAHEPDGADEPVDAQ